MTYGFRCFLKILTQRGSICAVSQIVILNEKIITYEVLDYY